MLAVYDTDRETMDTFPDLKPCGIADSAEDAFAVVETHLRRVGAPCKCLAVCVAEDPHGCRAYFAIRQWQ